MDLCKRRVHLMAFLLWFSWCQSSQQISVSQPWEGQCNKDSFVPFPWGSAGTKIPAAFHGRLWKGTWKISSTITSVHFAEKLLLLDNIFSFFFFFLPKYIFLFPSRGLHTTRKKRKKKELRSADESAKILGGGGDSSPPFPFQWIMLRLSRWKEDKLSSLHT